MTYNVFYSWQNDREPSICRYFIRDAIKVALDNISTDNPLDESPRLDHDTKDIPAPLENLWV
jgi:hypothetical protein